MSGGSTGEHPHTNPGEEFTMSKALFSCPYLIHHQLLWLLVQRKSTLWNQGSLISLSFGRNATDIDSYVECIHLGTQ